MDDFRRGPRPARFPIPVGFSIREYVMNVTITGRHLNVSDSLRKKITEKKRF